VSSTNRGGLARHPGDFYETPDWAIDLVLEELGVSPEFEGYVVDPGAGTGAIARRVAERAPRADVRGVEASIELVERARDASPGNVVFEHADFLTWLADGAADLVIGNPPYGKRWLDGQERTDERAAEKFILRSLEIANRKGQVAMLLRASFLVAKARRELRALPADILFLESRPSFNGSGCDSTDYAWFVWGPKRGGKWKVLQRRR
jgi:tRNA1(Val) A37 N6-methylase TrmN6